MRDCGSDRAPTILTSKYNLLRYVIDHWMSHSKYFTPEDIESDPRFKMLALHRELPFEFRPWGANQHFSSYGCKSCPGLDGDPDSDPEKLPYMGLLHWAASRGHGNLLFLDEEILRAHCDHERSDSETFLLACIHGPTEIVEQLISIARPKADAISKALETGNASTIRILLELRENTGYLEINDDKYNDLCVAAKHGLDDSVRKLLDRALPAIFELNMPGTPPLCLAASSGHDTVVSTLLEHGANVDALDRETEYSAMHYAVVEGRTGVMKVLLQFKPNLELESRDGHTALILACHHHRFEACRMLLSAGANPLHTIGQKTPRSSKGQNTSDEEAEFEESAIQIAISNDDIQILELLLGNQALVHQQIKHSDFIEKPLHLAAFGGHEDSVQRLLARGASIEARTSSGSKPLHFATSNGHTKVMDILLDKGASVDAQDNLNQTPLHYAARYGDKEVVGILLDRGA